MESKPVWLTIIFGVFLVTALVLWQHYVATPPPQHQSVRPVVIGVEDDPLSGLVIIAHEAHYFRQQHVQVALERFPTGHHALNAMLANQVQLATASNIPILIHFVKNRHVKILATISRAYSQLRFIVRDDRQINHPADLKGRRIATEKNSSLDYYTYLFLKHFNLKPSDVQLIYMPSINVVDALRGGYVDAFVMRSPYVEEAKALMPGQTIEFRVPKLYHVHFNLVTSAFYLERKPKTIRRILEALKQAELLVETHPDQAKADLVRFFGIGRRDEVITHWGQYNYKMILSDSLLNNLKSQLDWVVDVKKKIPAHMRDKVQLRQMITTAPMQLVDPSRIHINLQSQDATHSNRK